MKYIDALIPLLIGLALIARPQAFTKPTGSAATDGPRWAGLRKIGYALLGVGVLLMAGALFRH